MMYTTELRMGGDFELELEYLLRAPNYAAPTLPVRYARWTDTGRSALLLAAMDILRCGGRPVVWLPAFCCASVARTFRQAGFEPRFYSSSELHAQWGEEPAPERGDTVLLVHYFGRFNRYRAAQAEAWRRAGAYVVEDAVQASLTGGGVGATGHYVVTSLRKFLPQPDGALIGSHQPIDTVLACSDETFIGARVLGKLLRGANAAADRFLPLIAQAEARLDDALVVPREVSWLGRELMSRADIHGISERRRRNHAALHRVLAGRWPDALATVLGAPSEEEVPLGLPVRVYNGGRDALRRYLSAHAVFCPIHWALTHVPERSEYAADHQLASEILTLPIDQRMGDQHVSRLILLLDKFIGDRQ